VVALTFNAMVLKLQDNIRHLDDKVMQRTSELAKAYEELKQLDQLKSDFLSTVSHELRTPMTSIVGFVKLVTKKLEKTVFPQLGQDPKTLQAVTQVRENLDIIIAENERLTLLINDVLDSVKLEADEVEWNFVPLQPQRLIERATASTAALIKQSRLKFTSELEPDLPVVQGDEDRLLQVLVNLLGNAIKFTDSGQIGLRAQRQGGLVRFSVQDSGRGIAEKDQGRVFDKFKQIGETLTGKPTGTGLGLSICHQIITRHGGSIGLESSVGTGSTFYFTLPVAGPGVAVLQN
jgi:signal transduction histidine kinase